MFPFLGSRSQPPILGTTHEPLAASRRCVGAAIIRDVTLLFFIYVFLPIVLGS